MWYLRILLKAATFRLANSCDGGFNERPLVLVELFGLVLS